MLKYICLEIKIKISCFSNKSILEIRNGSIRINFYFIKGLELNNQSYSIINYLNYTYPIQII